jgi:anti-sigma regulatory factor (Ser/Thr protein kinase)
MTNLDQPEMPPTFRHEALFYAGKDEFLARTVPFIMDGVERSEPVLVVVDAGKIAALRHELNGAASEVQFADMAEVGRNPARIIPAWQEFVTNHGGGTRRLRGIGEPISAERSDAALAECHRHESLLNLAFAGCGDWYLLCPYDTTTLPHDVLEEAHRTHPFLFEEGKHRSSPVARGLDAIAAPFEDPLPEPPPGTPEFVFDVSGLAAVRVLTRDMGARGGLSPDRISDLALAVDEVATNSIRHGGGTGVMRIWIDDHAVVCDVRDAGRLDDPLVGRRCPSPDQIGGHGMWLVNQLCELVQIRSSMAGTIVRLHIERH